MGATGGLPVETSRRFGGQILASVPPLLFGCFSLLSGGRKQTPPGAIVFPAPGLGEERSSAMIRDGSQRRYNITVQMTYGKTKDVVFLKGVAASAGGAVLREEGRSGRLVHVPTALYVR
ncbi:hypothetical protein AAFF_G00007340 [Aldrovandia affinis]|uniref:Uncharacterized protein n=1 Tax=Aldrovandia affinis TaxID=143900 RepID=A0AAD7T640_9TELE|nr:hypothetical protein AAFF_G00007340 [Aldrovandia affinis]